MSLTTKGKRRKTAAVLADKLEATCVCHVEIDADRAAGFRIWKFSNVGLIASACFFGVDGIKVMK